VSTDCRGGRHEVIPTLATKKPAANQGKPEAFVSLAVKLNVDRRLGDYYKCSQCPTRHA